MLTRLKQLLDQCLRSSLHVSRMTVIDKHRLVNARTHLGGNYSQKALKVCGVHPLYAGINRPAQAVADGAPSCGTMLLLGNGMQCRLVSSGPGSLFNLVRVKMRFVYVDQRSTSNDESTKETSKL